MHKRVAWLVVPLAWHLAGCGQEKETGGQPRGSLYVLVGAGIRRALEPLKADFEKTHNCTVRVNYAGAGTLLGQLQTGAQADLYLPGDMWYVERAAERGMVESRRIVAWFVPVIGVRKGNPKKIRTLADLARPDVKVGLGRAEACAIGNTSRNILRAYGLLEKVKADFEALTVNRLANQVKLGALDAALIWDAVAKQYPDDIEAVALDDGYFYAAPLAVAVLKRSKNKDLARKFADFAASEAGAKHFRDNFYQVSGHELRVGSGSSFRPAVEELAALFEKEYDCEVLRDYGGSGTVLLQMQQSREGDVYICHDPFAYVCEEKGIADRWHTIAYIHPVLAVRKGNPKGVKGLKDLLRQDLRLGMPHRLYSTRGRILWMILEKQGMAEALRKRKFYESRTHDLINQLKLNAVDVAVLWDAATLDTGQFDIVPIEKKYRIEAITSPTSGRTFNLEHVKVTLVRLKFAKEPILAAQFARMCLSERGQAILRKHHFQLPEAH